jgi:putative transposase
MTIIPGKTACLSCEIIEVSARIDHAHLLAMVPPKVALSHYVGRIKGRTAIRLLNRSRHLREKPSRGNHFCSRGYCVDTVGLDSEIIPRYVKYRETKKPRAEQNQGKLF